MQLQEKDSCHRINSRELLNKLSEENLYTEHHELKVEGLAADETTDIKVLNCAIETASKVVVVLVGVHGAETYIGDEILTDTLKNFSKKYTNKISDDVAIVMVRVNPYGSKNCTRHAKLGHDLNRAGLTPEDYEELQKIKNETPLRPELQSLLLEWNHPFPTTFEGFLERVDKLLENEKLFQEFITKILIGQTLNAHLPFYSGEQPEDYKNFVLPPELNTIFKFFENKLNKNQKVVVYDIHSGLVTPPDIKAKLTKKYPNQPIGWYPEILPKEIRKDWPDYKEEEGVSSYLPRGETINLFKHFLKIPKENLIYILNEFDLLPVKKEKLDDPTFSTDKLMRDAWGMFLLQIMLSTQKGKLETDQQKLYEKMRLEINRKIFYYNEDNEIFRTSVKTQGERDLSKIFKLYT